MLDRWGWFPKTLDQWKTLVLLSLGTLAGWLTHPVLWLVGGPFRWWAMMMSTASQESSFNAMAEGDDGMSIGVLQFWKPTWEALGMVNPDDRMRPFLVGYIATRYVQNAIVADLRWLYIGLPFVGMGVLRHLWTNGPASATGVVRAGWNQMMDDAEPFVLPSWIFFRIISSVPAFFLCRAIYRLKPKKGK